ncbi:nickel/cobalt transporter [Promineifilum sp.]|uniref:nickel/cobalt transporter n=1 Tax=Promineifilum sp. TaxID=2664178 RepID=UPI0035B1C0E5
MVRRLAAVVVALVILGVAGVVSAHPLGNFTISRYSAVTLAGATAGVHYIVDMAEIPTFQERQTMDADGDGAVSTAEESAWLAETVPALAADLMLSVGGEQLRLQPDRHELSYPPGQGGLETLRLEVWLSAALPAAEGARDVVYEDSNFAGRLGWQEVVLAASEGALADSTVPATDVSNQLRDYPADLLQAPLSVNRAEARYTPQGAALTERVQPVGAAQTAAANRFSQDEFANLLSRTLDTPGAIAAALLVAVGLGAAHALTPGHGKTIVGAYLVGSRGTARHALFLGLTTTITHTAGVFALGFLVLFASRFVLPEKLYPWLGVLSGLLVVFIGASILRGHVRHWLSHRRGESHDHGPYHFHFGKGHSHGPDGHHHGPSAHVHAHTPEEQPATPIAPARALAFAGVATGGATRVLAPAHIHDDHDHAHDHGHSHAPHDHAHTHHSRDHHHEHDHHHDGEAKNEALTWRNLLALGISGGLLPCPSALVLMLSAIALRQVGVGLALILAFSVGLAGVLSGIGLIMVYAGRFLERLPIRHSRLTTRLLPMASATFITLAGLAITVRALVEAGVL